MHASPIHSVANSLAKQVATVLFKEVAEECKADFAVRLWDGTDLALKSNPQFTIVIRDPQILGVLLESPNELTLGESFVNGNLDVEGDLQAALQLGDVLMSSQPRKARQMAIGKLATILAGVRSATNGSDNAKDDLHSRERDRAAIVHHYDVSNDFYRLWLDQRLQYTAAYFESRDECLDKAQERKLHYICRKLNLRPGDKFLDIGCGWGGLVMHAAAHYGVQACGITLSARQAELALERIRKAGLEDRCAVRICDYRDVEGLEKYDKIASIGMIEHVGRSNLGLYFAQVWRLLRAGGLFLNSGIAASATWQRQGDSFMDRYVFPDGDLVPLHVTIQEAEIGGFEVRDVDCLREQYALTLDHWVHRLEEHANEARQAVGDITYRIWKLYMAASARGFRTNRINLYQTLFSKSEHGKCDLPLSRQDWYRLNPVPDQESFA